MSSNEQNILIVDDDPVVLKSLKDLLATRGIDANTAIGGREAIVCLDQKEYDLVLLDLQMPYVSGHDVMRHIKQNKMNLSIIIVSGETSFEAARDACSQGAYDFLRKPYATDELMITINKYEQFSWNTFHNMLQGIFKSVIELLNIFKIQCMKSLFGNL